MIEALKEAYKKGNVTKNSIARDYNVPFNTVGTWIYKWNNPEKYPGGSADEFRGAYSATFLKNLKDSYRRNRDLCILLTAGVYLLNIIDAHVDAHLQDYDISDDLSMNVEPYFDYTPVGSHPTMGLNLSLTF